MQALRTNEEVLNTWTHGLGLALSLLGFILLFTWHAAPMNGSKILILSVFGVTLVALYLASTLYHAELREERKRFLKYCDHAAIFLLIAGTYTPFCLIGTGKESGQWLAINVWILAFAGVIAKLFLVGRYRIISTLLYLLMGWLAIFYFEFLRALPRGELQWLIAGGVSYSLGTVFYIWKRLPFSHAIWHLFVLGGSVCHYLGVLFYLAS